MRTRNAPSWFLNGEPRGTKPPEVGSSSLFALSLVRSGRRARPPSTVVSCGSTTRWSRTRASMAARGYAAGPWPLSLGLSMGEQRWRRPPCRAWTCYPRWFLCLTTRPPAWRSVALLQRGAHSSSMNLGRSLQLQTISSSVQARCEACPLATTCAHSFQARDFARVWGGTGVRVSQPVRERHLAGTELTRPARSATAALVSRAGATAKPRNSANRVPSRPHSPGTC